MNQTILNNIIEVPCTCCESISLSLVLLDPSPTLYYVGLDAPQLATVEWQRYEGVLGWVAQKIGGTDLTPFVYGDGDLWRVKYTDTLGCIHYSNVEVSSLV